MQSTVIESSYPITFHQKEAKKLGEHIKNRHNVVMVGMRRVGISNFLRFFLYHPGIVKSYINKDSKHIFIPVDLNDLVEREIVPFWTLTLKRVVDAIQVSEILPEDVKRKAENYFLDSIQTQNLFLTLDKVRSCIKLIIDNGLTPTIFFIQFDRLKDAFTSEFYSNLVGLRDGFHQYLSYVFTSFRSLDKTAPEVFTRSSLVAFTNDMYVRPVSNADARIIYHSQNERYNLNLNQHMEKELFGLVDGYVRYLNLSLIALSEYKNQLNALEGKLLDFLSSDERVYYQSEELWESLESNEQDIVKKIICHDSLKSSDLENAKYLLDTGMLVSENGGYKLFSPLFTRYVEQSLESKEDQVSFDFTKKENALFNLLLEHKNEIVERETIIEQVWPEVEALGVSDWAIDRLVARVRAKMKLQNSKYEIQTVKTRGYKLVISSST